MTRPARSTGSDGSAPSGRHADRDDSADHRDDADRSDGAESSVSDPDATPIGTSPFDVPTRPIISVEAVRAAAASIGRSGPVDGRRRSNGPYGTDGSPGSTGRRGRLRRGPVRVYWAARDASVEAGRHLRTIPRSPDLLIFAILQPVMFVLLYVYVFGGSIDVVGFADYNQFVIPGAFAQAVVFGSAFTSIGLAEDMQKGYIDRLRSLPMSRSAVLVGRTLSDLVRNAGVFLVMVLVAVLVGFRFRGSVADGIVATALLLFFGYSMSWVQALIGLSVRSVEAANSAGYIWMFPFTFISSAFVDPTRMPGWLQPVARNNPFTLLTNASRALYNGRSAGDDLMISALWAVGIAAVFAAVSIRNFSRSTVA